MAKSNAERQAAYRQRKALEKQQGAQGMPPSSDQAVTPAPPDEDALHVSLNAPEQAGPTHVSLRERLGLGKKPAGVQPVKKAARGRGGKSKKEITLVSSALPAMLAGLLVVFIRDRLPEEYRPCAPTQQEASAILRPLFEEIARYVEITGRVSETTVNLTNCVIAMIAYGARSYTTYVEIKHDLQKQKGQARHEQQSPSGDYRSQQPGAAHDYSTAALGSAGRGDQAAFAGAAGTGSPGDAGIDGGRYSGDAGGDGAVVPDGSAGAEQSDADRVADLFRKDRAGRVRLGLLAA